MNSNNKRVIGTLSEYSVHRDLKKYFDENENNHEITLFGYVCDVLKDDGEIIEIQTKQFENLVPKLKVFLESHKVNVVYPVIETKIIKNIDKMTGEVRERKCPKKQNDIELLLELYKIRNYLENENLKISVVYINADEYRYKDNEKQIKFRKNYKTVDRKLTLINKIIEYNNKEDLKRLLDIEDSFDASTFSKFKKIKNKKCGYILIAMCELGIVKREKQGKKYIYYKH